MEEARRHARVAPVLRRALGLGLRVLPGAAPGVIYTTLLRRAPLRDAAHRILRRLIPAEIVLPEGRLLLRRHPDNKGKHSVLAAPELDAGVSVEAVTLDAALAELGGPRVDVIKLDVEGAEPLALIGMAETPARHRPVLFLECAPRRWTRAGFDPVPVLGGLKARGYALTLIPEGGGADTPVEPAALPARLRGRDPYVNLIARHR